MGQNETKEWENRWSGTRSETSVDGQRQSATKLTREEKKVVDAAFVGIIIGAGLTALIFAFL